MRVRNTRKIAESGGAERTSAAVSGNAEGRQDGFHRAESRGVRRVRGGSVYFKEVRFPPGREAAREKDLALAAHSLRSRKAVRQGNYSAGKLDYRYF